VSGINKVFAAKNIVKRFGRSTVLRGIDLDIKPGDFVTIFGANGAGKTTFLKISAMLLSPSSGDILFRGQNIRNAGIIARKELGFIAHDTFLYPNLTAYENLNFYSKLYGASISITSIESKLDNVGLLDRKNDLVSGFSRGMQQRLTIARAFLHDPTILLLDEPYTGLDRAASEVLNELIKTFYSTNNAGIMTTHNLDQGYDIATHVAIMSKGLIKYIAKTSEISKKQLNEKYMELVG